MLRTAVAHSEQLDAEFIVADFIAVFNDLDFTPQVAVLFMAIDVDHAAVLRALKQRQPSLRIIGCTTDGELSSSLGFREDSCVLQLLGAEHAELAVTVVRNVDTDLANNSEVAIAQLKQQLTQPMRLALAFPAALSVSVETVLQHLKMQLGPDVAIFGGTSADQWRFNQDLQFFDDEVLTNSCPLLVFAGPVSFSYGIDSGFTAISPPGLVTKAVGNVVYEIDQQPAAEFYQRFIGQGASPGGNWPLVVLDDQEQAIKLRAPIENHPQPHGAIACYGNVAEGEWVAIATADRDEIIDGCSTALYQATKDWDLAQTEAAFCFSCAARKWLLGTRTQEEHGRLQRVLGAQPVLGYYCYGELSPSALDVHDNQFHNQTFIVLLLKETV